MTRLVFATHNRGKLVELRALVAGASLDVVSLDDLGIHDEVIEDGATFHDNARKKAETALAQTGLPSLADDSGLEVDALDGAPGVLSARYAGEPSSDSANKAQLLIALSHLAPPHTARFRCVLALARAGAPVHFEEGTIEGEILVAPHGTGGFGYDPLFLAKGTDLTFAELPLDEKNRLSHRGQAMRRMAEILRRI